MRLHVLLFPLSCLLGCHTEGGAYVFLRNLCSTYAEDVCAARAHCCETVSKSCAEEVAAECAVTVQSLEGRDGLSYDANGATDVRSTLLLSLDACADPFLVPRFFSGALDDGADCSEDLECSSGSCVRASEDDATGTCTDATTPLCPAP